jgi:hypothetical protein
MCGTARRLGTVQVPVQGNELVKECAGWWPRSEREGAATPVIAYARGGVKDIAAPDRGQTSPSSITDTPRGSRSGCELRVCNLGPSGQILTGVSSI